MKGRWGTAPGGCNFKGGWGNAGCTLEKGGERGGGEQMGRGGHTLKRGRMGHSVARYGRCIANKGNSKTGVGNKSFRV